MLNYADAARIRRIKGRIVDHRFLKSEELFKYAAEDLVWLIQLAERLADGEYDQKVEHSGSARTDRAL